MALFTGNKETIILPDIAEEIGIVTALGDSINSFYGAGRDLHSLFSKKVDEFNFGGYKANNVKLDFGVVDPRENEWVSTKKTNTTFIVIESKYGILL